MFIITLYNHIGFIKTYVNSQFWNKTHLLSSSPMTRKNKKIAFPDFIAKFPPIELPITLGNDSHHLFSQTNDPLNRLHIDQYIALMEGNIFDDYTEVVPCFTISNTYEFHAIVYWIAGLMDYQYILATFTKEGLPIARKVIGGTYSDGKTITQSIATIDSDWTIHVVTGQSALGEEYDALKSTAIEIELLPDGHFTGENL